MNNEFKESKLINYFRFRGLTKFPFTENTFDALNEYQLLSKIVEYLNKVIEEQNIVTENTVKLIKLYEELKLYVDTYFDNLDIQNEINNKLDEYVEDGTFEMILLNYANLIKIYNNVDEMINDDKIVEGMNIKTLGYYDINDGGSGYYNIKTSDDISDKGSIIELKNGLKAYLNHSDSVNIKQFGANSEFDDNYEYINNAINFAYLKSVILHINSGSFKTSDITLKSNMTLNGDRLNSKLISISNNLLVIDKETVNVSIKNIHLLGNLNNGNSGIFINNEKLSEDTNHIISNCYIENFNGYGIEQLNFAHGIRINNCIIKNCNAGGIKYTSTDNWIEDCIIYFNKGNGIDIIDGSNNKIINTKTYGNTGHGVYVKGSNTQIVCHETQDNYKTGIYLHSCSGCLVTNLLSSANGGKFPDEPNIMLEGAYHNTIIGTSNMKTNQVEGFTQSLSSVKILNSSNNNINIKESTFNTSILPIETDDLRLSNNIIINDVNYKVENIVKGLPFKKSSTDDTLTEVFTAKNVRPNSDGSTSYLPNNGLKIQFNNNITIDYTSGIDVERYDDIIEGSTKSISYTKLSNFAEYQDLVLTMYHDYFNDAGGVVGTPSSITGIDGAELISTIPAGATRVRTKLALNPKKINLNNYCVVTDLKVGFI